ncbi:efflux transporter, outer membrane factor (OMF) lipoprotein, NodT family [Zunongwangia mangrovi]|uniref:Efflux transporter, outer membrane factor (OMF) lipoprotein, NodT family n=1 Tax=Zunongwangia mangrovi TaxID=1334022 RepID=A0A1I1DGN8_9FLAO|nr:efflux transporter outer membrane subunit [Zunongwangia mangrovi]SFB74149.1 efflux transporter, outer membrane factor (OMF) lipoprotein, NodT family [Zunongwangia mangrovi]
MKTKINFKTLVFPLVILSLQSCFVAKEYERPEVVKEENYRTDSLPQDSITMADVSWKDMFTDPILQGYIEEGLENNIDIRVAMQQILAAEAYLKQGKASYFPSLSGNASLTHQELSSNSQFGGLFSSLDQYEVSGSLSWEADIWGRIRSNKRAFEASYLQSVAAHQAVKTTLIANIASSYYQLVALDEQKEVTEKTIENRKKSLETNRALKEAGNITEVGVKQTEAQLYTAQALLIDINNQIRLLENTISILLAKEPTSIDRTTLEGQEIETELKTGVPAQLLRNRPDVMQAEYGLVNAFELTNAARANFYPQITLTATGGVQALSAGDLFDTNSLFATIVGGLTQPIFQRREIRTQYEVAQAQQEQARLQFRQAYLTATKEVADALYNYEASTDRIEIKEKEYDSYSTATDYSEELLNYGLANYLEVLTARENALNSRLDLINAKYSQLNSMVNLYQALGGGWQ